MRDRFCRLPLLLLLIASCGGASGIKPIPNLVRVTGTVTLGGNLLDQGEIAFAPESRSGQSATGQIRNGRFNMVTTVSAAGVVIGKYKVRVISNLPLKPPEKSDEKIPLSQRKMPEVVSLIPRKYNDVKTSGLNVEVKQGLSPVKFELEPEQKKNTP